MKPTARTTFADRTGRTLGRMLRGCVQRDQRAARWLMAHSWTPDIAKTVLAVVKLAVLGILLYMAFWLALLLVFAVAAAWAARNTDWDELQSEWRCGPGGYGLYRGDIRIDIGDPCEDE